MVAQRAALQRCSAAAAQAPPPQGLVPPWQQPRDGRRPMAQKYNKQPIFCHWSAVLLEATDREIDGMKLFNTACGGPVPDAYPLGYLSIGKECGNPSVCCRVHYVYVEFAEAHRVCLGQMKRWFPFAYWEQRKRSAVLARAYAHQGGVQFERGVFSGDQWLAKESVWWTQMVARIHGKDTFYEALEDPKLKDFLRHRLHWARTTWAKRPMVSGVLKFDMPGFWWQATAPKLPS